MKKKLFLLLLTVCVLAGLVGVMVGCGETLSAPRGLGMKDNGLAWGSAVDGGANLADGTLVWESVAGADGYLIYFNDNETQRFFTTDTKINIYDKSLRSSLKSGTINGAWVRAIKLNDKGEPDLMSDRSLITFNYSRKLATPNSVKLKGDKFSWRSVSDAENYKALVRKDGDTTAKLYDMTWATGTASVSGTINNLDNGHTYHVSIVAIADGYEDSEPSVDVTYDKSVNNVENSRSYYVSVGGVATTMSIDSSINAYSLQLNLQEGNQIVVYDDKGKEYAVAEDSEVKGAVPETNDYIVVFDDAKGTYTVTKTHAYYLYVANETKGTRLFFSENSARYSISVTLTESQSYKILDSTGALVATYVDEDSNLGVAYKNGVYTFTINADGEDAGKISMTVQEGGSQSTDQPVATDGQWPVTFDYNFEGAPKEVVYVKDNRAVATPATPTRSGYNFVGWYEDTYCMIEAEFGTSRSLFAITAPTTLYAKWSASTSVVVCDEHVDANTDGVCDKCGKTIAVVCGTHIDNNRDGLCDKCGYKMAVECDYHVDSDGDDLCDKCGREMPVNTDTYGKIYLDVTDFTWWGADGAIINVYIWYTDGSNTGFPGTVMTNNNNIYEADYYTSRTVKGIIFTRNDPNKRPDEGVKTEWNRLEIGEFNFDATKPVYKLLSYTNNGEAGEFFSGKWLAVGETSEVDPVYDVDIEYGKVYLDFRNVEWFTDGGAAIYGYVWYTDGNGNAVYPGRAVTYTTSEGSRKYSCYVEYNKAKTIAGVIFTRNNPAVAITGEGEGLWNKIEIGEVVWDSAYPAYRLDSMTGDYFEGHWESETEALSSTGEITSDPTPTPEYVTVYYYNADSWTTVKYHYWNESGMHNDAWPGAAMQAVEGHEGWYRGQMDKTATGIIFNDGTEEGAQSGNLVVDLSKLYYKGEWLATYPSEVVEPDTTPKTQTIYYYNANGWTNVYVYAWINDSAHNADWPGEAMTAVDGHDGWYKLEVLTTYKYVIFNNGNSGDGNQTKDLTIESKLYYYKGAWISDYPEEYVPDDSWDGIVTFNTQDVNWFENEGCVAYIHVWYADGTMNGWPATEGNADATRATRVEANRYTFLVDTSKEVAGFVLVRGKADGSEFYNKTGDITDIPDSHIINIAWMKGINDN